MPRCKPWSDEETQKLRDLWASMARRPEIVEQLGRSWPSIEGRAKKLKLGRRPRGYVAVIKGEARARYGSRRAVDAMFGMRTAQQQRRALQAVGATFADAPLPTEPFIPRSRIAEIQARAAVEG